MQRRRREWLWTPILLGVSWAGAAFAEEPVSSDPSPTTTIVGADLETPIADIEELSLEGLLGMDLEEQLGTTQAVSRTTESVLRAPATITTLDATQIRLLGATTIPDALRFVPGVAVYRSAPNNYVIALRGTGGLSGNNIVLLLDGIPINSVIDGSVSFDLIPIQLEDIERIEVVRGPVSPTYGANAYTGVINIVTRTTVGLSPNYVARLHAGADVEGKPQASLSGRFIHLGKQWQFKWFANVEHDAIAAAPAPGATSTREPPLADSFSTSAVLSWVPSTTRRLALEVGTSVSQRSSMEHLVLDSVPQVQRLVFGRALYEADALGALSFKLWTHGQALQIEAHRDETTGLSYDGSQSMRGIAGADFVLALPASFSLLGGGQGSVERISAPYIHPNVSGKVRPAYGFYAGLKAVPLPSLDLILTGRGDLDPMSTNLDFSYRASAIYHTDTLGLRVTGASAFRSPTYVEAAGRFIDPKDGLILLEGWDAIGTPRNTSVEVGAILSPLPTLTLTPTVYVSRLNNLMVEDFESLVRRTFRNDRSSVTYMGLELEGFWRATDAISIIPTFSMLHWLDTPERIETNVGSPDQNSRYTASLRAHGMFSNDRWGYGLGGTVVSPREYNVRVGIPTIILTRKIPTNVYFSGTLEREILRSPSIWASFRLSGSLPTDQPESPLPLAAPFGQSAIFGIEIRRDQ